MTIKNANDHPFKVALVGDSDMYANTHPFKVSIVEGGTELVPELPEEGKKGAIYVLVDDVENPTKVYGMYIYDNGWVLAAQPVDQAVQLVDELPEEGEEGVLYYVPKTGQTDTYDLYRWINNSWIKVDTDIMLYSSTGSNTDGAMTQDATTKMVFKNGNTSSVCIGDGADSNVTYDGTAVGRNTKATGWGAVAIGTSATAKKNYETSVGAHCGSTTTSAEIPTSVGYQARANGKNSVAVGAYATATQKGQFDISTGNETTKGYNNSGYRLLTGLYDPQSDHDASTKGYVDGKVLQNAGAPTTATEGTVGQLLEDTTNGKLYICTAIVPGTDPDPDTYTWEEVSGKPTVVQTMGTSQTDVMSQNAVSRLIYPDSGSTAKIAIGGNATTSGNQAVAMGFAASAQAQSSLALGTTATASGPYSVALPGSSASNRGEFAIGLVTSSGYNNTYYRLLTGLYDPQNAHDAATKGYVDNHPSSKVLSSSDYNWNSVSKDTTEPYDSVALWLLEDGLYSAPAGVKVGIYKTFYSEDPLCYLVCSTSSQTKNIYTFEMPHSYTQKSYGPVIDRFEVTVATGVLSASASFASRDTVTSMITDYIKSGNGTPSGVPIEGAGVLYEDKTNGKLYIYTAVSGSTYTWDEIATKGYVDNIVGNIESALNIINNGGES